MAIKIKINPDKPEPIVVRVKTNKVEETIQLQARKSLGGDIMIYDHDDIDIVDNARKEKDFNFCKRILR
jgi:hypothetical protein